MLLGLAWRNLWRRPTRTWLSILSMAFASTLLVFMLSFQLGVYDSMKSNALRIFDGFAQIQPVEYSDDPDISKIIANPEDVATEALRTKGITAAAPRASSFVILANGETSYGGAITGVSPAEEVKVSTLGSLIREGRYLQADDDDAIILGNILARNLGLELGDRVTLLGSAADRSVAADSLELVGIFRTGVSEMDRQIAEMPLVRFQETFAMEGGANVIVLGGDNLASVSKALPAVTVAITDTELAVRNWEELQPALKQAITLDFSTSLMWYISLVVVVVFIILNTLMMSVLERTREFGMLLAIGMKPAPIGQMLWMELVMLAVLGNGLGVLIGGALTLYFQSQGISFAGLEEMLEEFGLPGRLYPSLSAISALSGPAIIVSAIAIGGLVPYRRILKLEPVSAMGSA